MGCITSKCEADKSSASKPSGEFTYPKWDEANHSLLRKYLTEEIFNDLKPKQTGRGVTLRDVVNSGVVNQDSAVGVYFGDEECLAVFEPLVNPILEDYYKPYKVTENTHPPGNFDPSQLKAPNPDPFGKHIVSTRIEVSRNLKEFAALTPSLTKEERLELEKKVVSVLETLGGGFKGKYYPLKGMDEATRQKLVDEHCLFKKGDRFLDAAGFNRDWPEGRGVYYNDDKSFLVWLNEKEQIRIISTQSGGDIEAVFKRLAAGVNELTPKFGGGFQFNEHFGHISACPTNLGTALRASVFVKLPNAVKHPEHQAVLDKYHIETRLESAESDGVYMVSNRRRLGLSEIQCIQDMYEGIKKLLEIEKTMAASAAATGASK